MYNKIKKLISLSLVLAMLIPTLPFGYNIAEANNANETYEQLEVEVNSSLTKIPNSSITVSGDESAYENDAGAPLSNVNDGDRETLAELMWDHEPNYDESRKLPKKCKITTRNYINIRGNCWKSK